MKKINFLKSSLIIILLSYLLVPSLSSATGSAGKHFKNYKDWMKRCVVQYGVHGTASSKQFHLNEEKNTLKSPATIHSNVNLVELLMNSTDDENRFTEGIGVEITGYILDVKVGGVESCNCDALDTAYRDTHIFLVGSPKITSKAQSVIVEITPQIRNAMKTNSVDWSTKSLHSLIHKQVKVMGWLMYDKDHENASENIKHRSTNWRKTCWEVHPITSFEVLKDDETVDQNFSKMNGDYVNP